MCKLESQNVTVDKSVLMDVNCLPVQPLSTSNDGCGVDTEASDEASSIKPADSSSENAAMIDSAMSVSQTGAGSPAAALALPNCHMASQSLPEMKSMILPPNYGVVIPDCIYRSGFPLEANQSFLETLKLKTVLTLVSKVTPSAHAEWMKENGIKHVQIPILPNKEDEPSTPIVNFHSALAVILRRSSHPILIHCNQGRHRTGCVIACFRRLIGEDLTAAISEYHTYADPKARALDEVWIRNYDAAALAGVAAHEHWIGSPQQPKARSLTPVASRTVAPKIKA
ncbi:MAG: hypothetical protein Q9165_000746 [Trypethelium subeluteriae]